MVEITKKLIKDIGLQREVEEALPYAVVGEAWESSFSSPLGADEHLTALIHVVPTGKQLKILFLRIWTEETGGAIFSIEQTNPTAEGQTGTVEAYPVVGSVPSGVRDYPVLEGSINFNVLGATPTPATGSRYGIVYWGVEKVPEP